MAHTKNPWHKNTTHLKWWQLALITLVTFGGTVWATVSISGTRPCEILDSFGESAGFICSKLNAYDSTLDADDDKNKDSQQTVEFKQANLDIASTDKIKAEYIGKKLQFTNKSGKNYYVPFRYQRELDAFLKHTPDGVEVCEKDVAYDTSGSFAAYGVKECPDEDGDGQPDDPTCEIQVITGQQCRVKNGVTSWSVINQKKWIDGSDFDWDSTGLKADSGNSDNQYWKSKSNSQRTRCGGSGHYVGSYAWGPRHNGDEWAKYKCEKSGSWTCFWSGCNYWWTLASDSKNGNITTKREYTSETITGKKSNYGSKCTQGYYTFSGTYESTCYNDGGDMQLLQNNSIFGQAYAQEIFKEGDGEGYYACQNSCSDYNTWSKTGTTPYAPAGCSSNGYSNTRIGACNNSCYNKDTCTNDSNCELYDDGSTSKEYSDACTFDWQTGAWEANTWQECRLQSAYDGTGNKVVSKNRDVTCIATPIDGEIAPYGKLWFYCEFSG